MVPEFDKADVRALAGQRQRRGRDRLRLPHHLPREVRRREHRARTRSALARCARWLIMLASLFVYTFADLASKEWALDTLSRERSGDSRRDLSARRAGLRAHAAAAHRRPGTLIDGYLEFRYAENCGAAFGMLRTAPSWVRAAVFGVAAHRRLRRAHADVHARHRGASCSRSRCRMILSGAIGNLSRSCAPRLRGRLHPVSHPRTAGSTRRSTWPTSPSPSAWCCLLIDGMKKPEPAARRSRRPSADAAPTRLERTRLSERDAPDASASSSASRSLLTSRCSMFGYAVAIYNVVRWAKRVGVDHQSVIDAGLASIIGGVLGGRLLHVFADGYFWDYVHLCTDPAPGGAGRSRRAQCKAAEGLWDAAASVCRPERTRLPGLGQVLQRRPRLLRRARRAAPGRRVCVARARRAAPAQGRRRDRHGRGHGPVLRAHRLLPRRLLLRPGHRARARHAAFPPGPPPAKGSFAKACSRTPAQLSLPVHPTQLYEAVGCLLHLGVPQPVGAATQALRRPGRAAVPAAATRCCASALEFLRADDRGLYLGVSTSQWISIAIIAAAAVVWRKWSRASEALPALAAAR